MNSVRHAVVSERAGLPSTSLSRHLVESLVLLGLAVTLFRCFAAEGYMISTGSMAPTLLGYHRRVVCPDCHLLFARGAAFDPDDDSSGETALADFDKSAHAFPQTCCPNCGRLDIAAWKIPKNEGDQLLVHKFAYEFRDPRRWEVIVFRNPSDPRQAYVKRVAGLPGETITIREGEVFADGTLCRKPAEIQRAVRMLVADFTHHPPDGDPDWRPRWLFPSDSGWSSNPSGCDFRGKGGNLDWFEYRNWIRHGGRHVTSVPLKSWPQGVEPPNSNLENLLYDNRQLSCVGAFSDLDLNRWSRRSDDPAFQQALLELFERSHVAPITDDYGYNSPESSTGAAVRDFQAAFRLKRRLGEGRLLVELDAGGDRWTLEINYADETVRLQHNDDSTPIRFAPLPDVGESGAYDVEFSCFDAQVLVTIDGGEPFPAFPFSPSVPPEPVRVPLRIGAADLDCSITDLRLYRDVYYTSKPDVSPREFAVGPDAYFVLGDNSPVSVDSRVWEDHRVPKDALIGKPLVVHLPSRQAGWDWQGTTRFVRVPDFSRIRSVK